MRKPKSKSIRIRKKFLKKIILNPENRKATIRGFIKTGNLNAAMHLMINPVEFYTMAVRSLKK